MASQRVAIIKIAGRAAQVVASRLRQCQEDLLRNNGPLDEIRRQIDTFAGALRANSHKPPIVYFSEWTDFWSMGDLLPALGDPNAAVLAGRRFEICCHRAPIQFHASTIGGDLSQEAKWLKHRLAEAGAAWDNIVADFVIIVLREPLGGLVTDEELADSLDITPEWLAEGKASDAGQ